MEKKVEIKRVPVIDTLRCTLCGSCMDVCPHNVIEKVRTSFCDKCVRYCVTMDVPCNPNHLIFHYNDCDSCGKCVENCEYDAIYWFEVKG